MTQYSKANFISLYNTTFADNTTGDISEADMRQFVQDTADSVGAGLFTTKVTVSSAQILALNTTPQTLVAAGGAGTLIEVTNMTFFLDYNTTTYATNLNLQVYIGTSTPANNIPATVLSATSDHIYTTTSLSVAESGADVINQPVYLTVGTGNPTAGDSPLYVYVTYRVITL